VVAVVGVLLASQLARLALADYYRTSAEDIVATEPLEALREVGRSQSFDDQSVDAYYIQAAAFAQLDGYDDARGALAQAAALEASNPVPWALLGDLAVRRRDFDQARADYAEAQRRDPRNQTYQRLVEDPRAPDA
jgi:uncharacterized protein HemY